MTNLRCVHLCAKKSISLLSLILVTIFSFSTEVKADHIWGARNLVASDDGTGMGTFKIDFEFYRRNGWTSDYFQYELYVVEEGCSASDGFTAAFFGCTDATSGVNLQWNPGELATGLQLCPGKTYNIVLYTRRRGNEGGPPCGSNEDRAGAASPLGELVKFPNVGAGDPAGIWAGAPANAMGDTPTFDGNWAYLINSLNVVVYPTSEFNTPTQINCSDACGQELIIAGAMGDQWQTAGINMGTATTLPFMDNVNMTFDFTGQICTPSLNPVDCESGNGSVMVDECASCGIYDITYKIADNNCTECTTTTTKQVQIISPVITNVMVTEMTNCGTFIPNLSYDVKACNPADGSASTTDYSGAGAKFWERNDMPGVLIPDGNTALEVIEGTTVTFTPTWDSGTSCDDCNVTGTPITVTAFADPGDPTNGNTTQDICEGDAVTLNAVCPDCPDGSAVTVEWYANATGGTSQSTGAGFTPVSATSVSQQGTYDNETPGLYTFFAECVCNGCPSNRVPYSVEVVEEPIAQTPNTIEILCTTSPVGTESLIDLFPGADPDPSNFTANAANPASIQGAAIAYSGPGCYCVDYEFDNGTCPVVGPVTSCVIVTEQPEPAFSINNQVCITAGDPNPVITPSITSPTYSGTVERLFTVTGPATTTAATGVTTITGEGTVVLTLEETIDYPACGSTPAGNCTATTMVTINVEDGQTLDPTFTLSNEDPCPGEVVTLTPNMTGGVFSGTGVTDNGLGTGATFTATNCASTYSITYTVLSPLNGCVNAFTYNLNLDSTDPVITKPADITVECDGSGNMADLTAFEGGFSATDNCVIDTETLMVASQISTCEPGGNTFVRSYSYTVEDECGNTLTEFASITILDSTDPVITPLNTDATVVECNGSGNSADIVAFLSANGGLTDAEVTEDCGMFAWMNDYDGTATPSVACAGGVVESYVVNFWVEDNCGNTSNLVSRTLEIQDNTAPALVAPASITVECGATNTNDLVTLFLNGINVNDDYHSCCWCR